MADGDEFDFLAVTKTILGISNDSSFDIILQTYISMTIQTVLNYCNISELPSALNYVVCLMTAETYREVVSKNNVGEVVGAVNSISEGGRSVSFGGTSDFKVAIEDKVSHRTELNRYKKLFRM
jgi:hypothetical protein